MVFFSRQKKEVNDLLVSTKGRYALRVMLELAEKEPEEYISLKYISEKQDISLKYLEIIMALLHKNNLVDSKRGKAGGYRLNKKVGEYTVGEILRTTEDGLTPVECSCVADGFATCGREQNCMTKNLWKGLDLVVSSYFDQITLEDIMKEKIRI